jgi:DNA-binding response OmpR family regulator
MPTRIFVAESDALLAGTLIKRLRGAGFEVDSASDGATALAAIRGRRPELVIAAVELPGVDGLEICKVLRSQADTRAVGMIILSAKADAVDRILGFELGADDYIVKPVEPREMIARIHSVLRRLCHARTAPQRVGGLEVDRDAYTASVEGKAIQLTAREFALLTTLVSANGRVVRRITLLKDAWELEHGDEIASRTLDSHMARLRQKLGSEAERLVTIKGIGYRFDVSENPAETA